MTASSSTTCARRSSGGSPESGSASSPEPRSSTASTGPSAMRSWNDPAPLARSSRSSGRTSSWCRSTVSASGTGTTTCSATCFGRSSRGASPRRSRSCIGAPRTASRKLDCSRRRFVHAHASGDGERAAELLQRMGLAYYRNGRSATLRRWLDLLGEDVVARNGGLALMAAWIAALSGDPVAADRWASAADHVPLTGPSFLGSASLRSTAAMVHATMSRGGAEAMYQAAQLAVREEPESSPFRASALAYSRPRDVDPWGRRGGRRPVRRGFGDRRADRRDERGLARVRRAVADRHLAR